MCEAFLECFIIVLYHRIKVFDVIWHFEEEALYCLVTVEVGLMEAQFNKQFTYFSLETW